jgi:hypothetical protein
MNKKFISLLVVSLAFVSACAKPASSSAETSKSESVSESASTSQSASESKSESATNSTSSETATTIKIMPSDAPDKDTATNTYPADAEYTVGGAKFEFSQIMKGSQQPLDKDGKTIKTNIPLIQAAGETGYLYNTEALKITNIKMIFLNKVSTYNPVYPIESVYTGDTSHPATTKASVVTPVESLSSEGYKIFTQEFAFATPISYFTIANDDYFHADASSSFRAIYFFSIEITALTA